MLLVDAVTDYGADHATCALTVRQVPPFGTADAVPALVGLEYMAQAVGAYVGLRARDLGQPILPGFLIGVPALDLSVTSFAVGDQLTAHVRRTWGDDRLGSFDTTLARGGDRVASATLRAFRADPAELGLA
jgi:predicted hotdog family 3-hydroxylacyl-ACP dehydratase